MFGIEPNAVLSRNRAAHESKPRTGVLSRNSNAHKSEPRPRLAAGKGPNSRPRSSTRFVALPGRRTSPTCPLAFSPRSPPQAARR